MNFGRCFRPGVTQKRTSEVRFKKRRLPSNDPSGQTPYADVLRPVIPYARLTDPAFAGSVSPYPPILTTRADLVASA